MKQIFFLLVIALVAAGCDFKHDENLQTTNAILGDRGFEIKYGFKPDRHTGEVLRIRTHLEYVEALLRNRDVSELPLALREKRRMLLDRLHEYYLAGNFPSNYDYPGQRTPCFIDKNERICAVGYLVEKTAGRRVAEQINSKHQYEKIMDMKDPMLDEWIDASGLTKMECAMIQPSYNWEPLPPTNATNNHIDAAYGVSSAVLGGLNLSLNVINSVQLSKNTNNVAVPVFGIIMGSFQVALGAIEWPEEMENSTGGITTNESQKALSMVNIGLGTSTLLLSTWNLIHQSQARPKTRSSSWNLYGFPADRNLGVGFYYAKKF